MVGGSRPSSCRRVYYHQLLSSCPLALGPSNRVVGIQIDFFFDASPRPLGLSLPRLPARHFRANCNLGITGLL